jgi:hypothetical protein
MGSARSSELHSVTPWSLTWWLFFNHGFLLLTQVTIIGIPNQGPVSLPVELFYAAQFHRPRQCGPAPDLTLRT